MSAHLGEDYKPLKPSDTIKELSDMCFGGESVDHAAELAEALEAAMYWMHGDCLGDYDKCKKVLANYKQSRGGE